MSYLTSVTVKVTLKAVCRVCAAVVARRKVADGGSSQDDSWMQHGEQAQCQAKIRRNMLAPGHLVSSSVLSGRREYDDEGTMVGFSFIGHEGAKWCATTGSIRRKCLFTAFVRRVLREWSVKAFWL